MQTQKFMRRLKFMQRHSTSNLWLTAIVFSISTLVSTNSMARYSLDRNTVKAIVVEEAIAIGVDPALALAVAQVESDFNPTVVSHAGARGVMQIMPKTAREDFGVNPALLFDARTNIRTGVTFLKQLQERYGSVEFALSHYNGGSRVTRSDGSLQVIPATRGYVDKVLSRMKNYYSYRPNKSQQYFADGIKRLKMNPDMSISALSPSYREMREKAKNSLLTQSQLHELRQKNMRLAKVVHSTVDPYLQKHNLDDSLGYRATRIFQNRSSVKQRVRPPTLDITSKRQQVLEWESVYAR